MEDYFKLRYEYGIYTKLGKLWGVTRTAAFLYVKDNLPYWKELEEHFDKKKLDINN